jgi:hypothetical protein
MMATGFAIWNMTTYRHHIPPAVSYREYYAKRCSEGALWFDNSTQSKDLLTGGFGVQYADSASCG